MESNIDMIKTTEHKMSSTRFPLVEVQETYALTPEKLFEYWSDPKLLKSWWGPEGYSCPVANVDFRVGGKFLSCMREDATGEEVWSTGKYLHIEKNKKIVNTDYFSNEDGDIIPASSVGHDGQFEDYDVAYVTVEFVAVGDNKTKMSISHEGLPASMHDDCVKGWTSSLKKLKRIIEKH